MVAPNPTGDPTIRLMTMQGVSHNPQWMVVTSLVTFTVLYGVLMVVWGLLLREMALGPALTRLWFWALQIGTWTNGLAGVAAARPGARGGGLPAREGDSGLS